ncbi:hypothetical protein R1sor_012316 [Riccia sorocarpa]|uniref:ATPsynthase alpha/beta subunit barrel-sandwich domain-containing protein n=1 Tax=Riccia sorocarpa TaxID=122646 RepID=A0ABD3I781_9MARC
MDAFKTYQKQAESAICSALGMSGTPIKRTNGGLFDPLSVELGPGILENIFDGVQPLQRAATTCTNDDNNVSWYIPRGVAVPALDRSKLWDWEPRHINVGDAVTGGDLYGTVFENSLIEHPIGVPPGAMGKVTFVAPPGKYSITSRAKRELLVPLPTLVDSKVIFSAASGFGHNKEGHPECKARVSSIMKALNQAGFADEVW